MDGSGISFTNSQSHPLQWENQKWVTCETLASWDQGEPGQSTHSGPSLRLQQTPRGLKGSGSPPALSFFLQGRRGQMYNMAHHSNSRNYKVAHASSTPPQRSEGRGSLSIPCPGDPSMTSTAPVYPPSPGTPGFPPEPSNPLPLSSSHLPPPPLLLVNLPQAIVLTLPSGLISFL